MNYYEHHIGDYDKATAHLTACEDGIYSRLLRRYYDTEAPLPADIKALQRLVRARAKDEREAVETVLHEFFELDADGWRHSRCDAEIARYQEKRAKAKRSADARWAKQNEDAEPMRTHSERNANASPEHDERNALQSPDTRHQEKEPKPRSPTGSRLPADWALPDEWLAWGQQERPELDVAGEGDKFRDFWHGKAGKDGRKADWLATWRNWVRNARAPFKPANGRASSTGYVPLPGEF